MSEPADTVDLITTVGIDALLAARDGVQEVYAAMARMLAEAQERLAPFGVALPRVTVHMAGGDERTLGDRWYDEGIRVELDRLIWVRLFELSHVDTLMDSQTRKELWDRLHGPARHRTYRRGEEEQLPPLTRENIAATMEALHAQGPTFFENAVEALYRRLSWDHKTNRPARLSSKLIIQRVFDGWACSGASVRFYSGAHDAVHDLERVLLVLEGSPPATHDTGLRALGEIPWATWTPVPRPDGGEPLFRVKAFRNGNAHVEILAAEHVAAMNRILARRYPGAIPEPEESKASRRRGQYPAG